MTKKFMYFYAFILGAALLIWITGRFLLPIALPFLLGLWLALGAEPVVRLLHQKLHLPRWAATALSVTAVFLLTVTVLTLLVGLLMRQLTRLQDVLPQLEAAITQALAGLRQWLTSLPGSLGDILSKALEGSENGGQLTENLLQDLPGLLANLVSRLSSGLFGLLTGIISGYMISCRLPQLRAACAEILPECWHSRYLPALKGMRKALGGWLFAQVKLAAVAFVLLLVGFWILSIENSLLLAALVTLVDAFPVLGVGTVLLPWSLIWLAQGQIPQGLGLLALYAVIWLTRSVLEPKLVGKGLGLDPLLTLVSIYAGWRLFGIPGMLLAPIFTMAAVHLWKALKR